MTVGTTAIDTTADLDATTDVDEQRVAELHRRYAADGDRDALTELVAEYEGLARSLARRMHRGDEPLADLQQVAYEALLRALDRFDPDRGVPFAGFAVPTILGALKRHYRDRGWGMRVPRQAHETASAARDASDRLTMSLGRPASVAEVAHELGTSEDELLTQLETLQARNVRSVDAGPDGPDRWGAMAAPDPAFARAENRIVLRRAMGHLGDRDRRVVGLYYFEGLTQSEIGERYGVSQMQVSRWLSRAVRQLRSHVP